MSPSRSLRVLARLIPLCLALGAVPSALQAGEPPGDITADLVLGQADFVSGQYNRGDSPAADTLGQPQKVAIDRSVFPNRVYVADTDNQRVFAWSSAVALTHGLPADRVFGQNGSFVTNEAVFAPTTAATLIAPAGVVVDGLGNLYVSSQQENRVLRYNAPFSSDLSDGKGDVLADAAFGQPDLVTRGSNPDATRRLAGPNGLAVDSSDNLYVADGGTNRVLRFANAGTATSGASATAAFGQPTLTSVVQNNGGVSASSLFFPRSASISADGDLYVADSFNSRVLRYANPATAVTGTAAIGVFGQPDFTTNTTAVTASKLNGPYDANVDAAGNLWVADAGNNRVLRYDAAGLVTTPGPVATAVLGQGGTFTTGTATTTANGLSGPAGVTFDALGNVYVADLYNNRVVRFDGGSPGIPAPPTDLVATPGNGSASISFTAPDGSISNYQYSTNDGASYTALSPADATSPVTITGLTGGVTYAVRLRAVGTYGAGVPSEAVSVTPIAAIAGTCGTAAGAATASAPSAQLCATGVAGSVSSSGGQWAWSCNGTGGSVVNASCAAPFQTQTLSLSANPTSIAVGAASTVTASSTSGLAPSLSLASDVDCTLGTSSGSVTVTAAVTAVNAGGSCTVRADRAASANGCTSCYQAASQVTTTITLTKASQTITFGTAPTGLVVGGSTGTVSATASSGLAVSFSNGLSMFCGVNGSTVTPLRAGTCTVLANQGGNANYNLAPQQSQNIVIGKGSQTITGFAANPVSPVVGGSASLSASGGASGTAVTFSSLTTGVCTVAGNTLTAVSAGSCSLRANQAGNADYNAAAPASLTITVGKGSQSISGFTASPGSLMLGGGSASLSATGGASGNAVSFGSSTTGVCTVSGNTVTAVSAGLCSLTANQLGNANYNAASQESLTVTVGKASQSISGFTASPGSLAVGGGSASLSATGGASGNAVSFGSSTTGICTVSGNTVTVVSAGTCSVVANQSGNANYNAASQVTLSISVGRGSQSISGFTSSDDSLQVNRGTATVSASGGSSGNAPSFASSTGDICAVSGSTVTAVAAGTCTITANQAGNDSYNAAAEQTLAITVTADSTEDTVPSGTGTGTGDGNGDALQDSIQSSVASLPTLTGNSYATIVSVAGRTLSQVDTVAVPSDFPTNVSAPLSGVAFTVAAASSTETIELYFPASDRVVGLRKLNRVTGVYDDLPVTVTSSGNRTRISFTLTDGGDYDADGLVNGSITDPVFPVVAPASSGGGATGWLTLLPLSLLALIRRRFAVVRH